MEIIRWRCNLQKTWLDQDMTLKAWNVYLPIFCIWVRWFHDFFKEPEYDFAIVYFQASLLNVIEYVLAQFHNCKLAFGNSIPLVDDVAL